MAPGRRRASPTQRHQWPCAHNTHKSTRMRSMLPIRPRRAPPCRCRAAAPASTPRMQRGGVFQSPYTHRKHTDDHADEYGQVGNPMCHTPHIRGIWVVMRVKSLVEGGHAQPAPTPRLPPAWNTAGCSPPQTEAIASPSIRCTYPEMPHGAPRTYRQTVYHAHHWAMNRSQQPSPRHARTQRRTDCQSKIARHFRGHPYARHVD